MSGRTRRRVGLPALAVAAALALVSCASAGAYEDTPLPTPTTTTPSSSTATTPSPSPSSTNPDVTVANCLQSYAPPTHMPAPGHMPADSTMEKIQRRGHLVAGVSADTLLLGSRNPVTGVIEGFDIDMLHAVSQAIFGRPVPITYRVITAAEREDRLKDDSVDIVARAMTITCKRWTSIAFSTEYYRSGTKVLVRLGDTAKGGGPITGMKDLVGRKVCAPKGTTTMQKLQTYSGVIPVAADTHTGCLVLFQEGKVDGIIGDATVLAGLAAQDPYADIVKGAAFSAEPYGLGIKKENVDFVSFVNGVLAQVRSDGQWTRSYNQWLLEALGKAPNPPTPVYGRNP